MQLNRLLQTAQSHRRTHLATLCIRQRQYSSGAHPFQGEGVKDESFDSEVSLRYEHKYQPLHDDLLVVDKQAYGIPFHISDDAALDAVCRHHGASVKVHACEKLLMPYWMFKTSCGGVFKADLFTNDPTYVTRVQKSWIQTPRYEFSYPLEDHFIFNQVSASYVHPSSAVEQCLSGTHIPSMLIQRYELLEEMDAMPVKAKLIPFVKSTNTALKDVEARLTRDVVMTFINKELKKYHGNFLQSSVTLSSIKVNANGVRPVFLPMYRYTVSTRAHSTPVPAYVCGAIGKATGPVLRATKALKSFAIGAPAIAAMVLAAPMLGPDLAITIGAGVGVLSSFLLHMVRRFQLLRTQAKLLGELKTTSFLNFASDQKGYKWNVADEERTEYEYREELRKRARRKDDFKQRIQEESARDEARARGVKFDPSTRRRNDLKDVDPLGFYKLLGLEGQESSASVKDIQRGFREESKKHHPDLNVERGDEANKVMQRILEAYKVLRDPKLKKDYDTGKLKEGAQAEAS